MPNRLLSTIAIVTLLSAAGAVKAADIVEPAYEEVEEPAPLSTAGWYLRGDVGYVFKSKTDGVWSFYNQFDDVEGIDDFFRYDELKTDPAASFGVGAGYRFTDMLRGDVTVDYFKADAKGSTDCPSYITASMGLDFYNDCHYQDDTKADVWTAMANAYVDIGHFGIVTPYVGAGIGAAHVKYGDWKSEEVCGSDPACKGENSVFEHEGESSWRFASSLMAGATVDLTQQLKLDAGYRYTRIEDGDAHGYDAADKDAGASGVQLRDNGFDVHTLRAGLRYEFGGGAGFGY